MLWSRLRVTCLAGRWSTILTSGFRPNEKPLKSWTLGGLRRPKRMRLPSQFSRLTMSDVTIHDTIDAEEVLLNLLTY